MDAPSSKHVIAAAMAAAVASAAALAASTPAQAHGEAGTPCYGINKCQGLGDCGGKGHGCHGKNACSGQGYIMMDERACMRITNGRLTAEALSEQPGQAGARSE